MNEKKIMNQKELKKILDPAIEKAIKTEMFILFNLLMVEQ